MPDLSTLLQGNNLVYIILAVLAYFVLVAKKDPTPTPPTPTPVDPPAPQPPGPVTPDQRPIIDAVIKILPTILPLIIPLLAKASKDHEEATKTKESA